MLNHTTSKGNDTCLNRRNRDIVESFVVLSNVKDESFTSVHEMIDNYISNLTVSESRRKNWDIVFPAPIEDTLLIVYFFTETIDDLAR
jgi:hypothetical protein